MKMLNTVGAAVMAVALSHNAQAQFKNDEQAVQYRQGVMLAMKVHFGRLGAMAQGKMPFDAELAKRDAQIVQTLSSMPWMGFTEGSDGLSKSAKPEIWMETNKFQQRAQALQENTALLAAAAQSADLDRIKAAVGTVGKSCKACHDSFKQ